MRQLTAYSRPPNPGVTVVAGEPAVRALSWLSARYFDYACAGGIEQLRDMVREVLDTGYAASGWRFDRERAEMSPRYAGA
jgi:hypothetical protein